MDWLSKRIHKLGIEFLNIVNKTIECGYYEDELNVEIAEDIETVDFNELVHRVIPETLKEILKIAGFNLYWIYHKSVDLPLSEYIILIPIGNGKSVLIELDVVYNNDVTISGFNSRIYNTYDIPEGLKPFYHLV